MHPSLQYEIIRRSYSHADAAQALKDRRVISDDFNKGDIVRDDSNDMKQKTDLEQKERLAQKLKAEEAVKEFQEQQKKREEELKRKKESLTEDSTTEYTKDTTIPEKPKYTQEELRKMFQINITQKTTTPPIIQLGDPIGGRDTLIEIDDSDTFKRPPIVELGDGHINNDSNPIIDIVDDTNNTDDIVIGGGGGGFIPPTADMINGGSDSSQSGGGSTRSSLVKKEKYILPLIVGASGIALAILKPFK